MRIMRNIASEDKRTIAAALNETDLASLIHMMKTERGWDFSGYKPASLKRRVLKVLNAHQASSLDEYRRMLERDPSEYDKLLSTITIQVSEFFREPEVFTALKKLLREAPPSTEKLRVWSCGCAYGEEPYSIAIMLSETLGPDVMRRATVFATDICRDAIEQARRGVYRMEQLHNVDTDTWKRHFRLQGGHNRIGYDIRNHVKFGVLDIVTNHPIPNVHILFCRNLFIYFNKALQGSAFAKLDYSLKKGGLLVMGRAEIVPTAFAGRYERIDGRLGIYRKIAQDRSLPGAG